VLGILLKLLAGPERLFKLIPNAAIFSLQPMSLNFSAHILRMALIAAVLFGGLLAHASAAAPVYTGHYELADAKADRSFTLDVKQDKNRADISFSASMADGSGAAPDGTGKGRVEDGVLSFSFEDSFNNKGTCTLQLKNGLYFLNMTVVKIADISPLHFYGTVSLKKTSSKAEEQ